MTWDAIEMLATLEFETKYQIEITDAKIPAYGIPKSGASPKV
jgi:hypothetical protein